MCIYHVWNTGSNWSDFFQEYIPNSLISPAKTSQHTMGCRGNTEVCVLLWLLDFYEVPYLDNSGIVHHSNYRDIVSYSRWDLQAKICYCCHMHWLDVSLFDISELTWHRKYLHCAGPNESPPPPSEVLLLCLLLPDSNNPQKTPSLHHIQYALWIKIK